jgi:predicted alpha/beta-fold hydrolase
VTEFRPPAFLRNAHLQSALASLPLRRRLVERGPHRLPQQGATPEIIECGGGVRLLGEFTAPRADPPAGTVVLIHGWEGSARSMYMLSVAGRLHADGYRVVRLNLRDHGDSQALNAGIFHSCRLPEVVGAVAAIRRRFPDGPLFLAGFSLGGNFALRVAADPATAPGLAGVVAVCPVLDPRETMRALDGGLAAYRIYFLRRWSQSLALKQAAFPDLYDFGDLARFRNLTEMTDYFVTRHTEYPDLETYLRGYAITEDRLAGLSVPSQVLLADDDPVIPVADVARLPAVPALRITRSRFGGHCGFLASWSLRSWLDEFVSRGIAVTASDSRIPATRSPPPAHPRNVSAA